MNRKWRNILFAFGTISLLPILFIGIFLTVRMRTMAYELSLKEANAEIFRVKHQMEEMLAFIYHIQNAIISDTHILDVAQESYSSTYEIFDNYSNSYAMKQYELIYSEIADIRIYVENETLLDNMDFMRITPEIKKEHWYKKAIELKGQSYGEYYTEGPISKYDYLMVCRSFHLSKDSEGVIIILVDLKRISDVMDTEKFDLLLVDRDCRILASRGKYDVGKQFDVTMEGMDSLDEMMLIQDYKGVKSQIIVKMVDQTTLTTPLFFISVIPIQQMVASTKQVSLFGFWVVLLSLAAGLALSFGLSGLASHQQQQQYLLFKEQMRFEILASQVSPHFLFNLLESIRMKAHLNGDSEIATVVKKMGLLIRRNLELQHDFIMLKEELKFVEDYLLVQKFRFGDKIQSKINCREELKEFIILPLTIQPIIENAIIHGLEGIRDIGIVTIDVAIENKKLVIKVIDNGAGIDANKRKYLLEDGDPKCQEKRIGVLNVHQRIQYKFGKAYGLKIEENLPRGTSVFIIMPILTMGDVKNDIINEGTYR